MDKPWWIAYPDGRKFNLDEKELVSGVESGNIPAWVQGSYQGGPYVPISQSPAVQSALSRKAERDRDEQQADTKNKLQVFGAIGGVVLVLVIGGFLISQWNASVAEDKRKSEVESKEKAEAKAKERAEREFREMPAAQKIEKARSLASIGAKESLGEALRYLDAIPESDAMKVEAKRTKSRVMAQVREIERKEAEERERAEKLGPIPPRIGKTVLCVKDYLRASLKDPDSLEIIEWGELMQCTVDREPIWCVEVSFRAKNSFGGFVVTRPTFYIRNNRVIPDSEF